MMATFLTTLEPHSKVLVFNKVCLVVSLPYIISIYGTKFVYEKHEEAFFNDPPKYLPPSEWAK